MFRSVAALLILVGAFASGFWLSSSGLLGGDSARIGAESDRTVDAAVPAQTSPGFPGNTVVVTVAEVELTPPRLRLQSIGTGKAVRFIRVTAEVAGTVESISVEPNTDVSAGEPIITFERETQRILLGSAEAELEKQSSAFSRLDTLFSQNSNAVSQSQLEDARASLAIAEANVAAAQYEFDRRVVRAPFSGRINLNDLTVGDYLAQGAKIVTLVDASSLLVEFTVSETAVPQVATGVGVRLTTPAYRGRVFSGTIVAFDSAIDEESRTVRVRAEVQNPANLLLPGMTFSVGLASADEPMPMIPAVSVLWKRSGAYVWRVGEDNRPEDVSVVLRHRLGDRVWVEGDLSAGDRVVRDGAFKVSEGALLQVDTALPTPSVDG
ncbi:MAG: efflux RND transporter periplasmic adaptor subunit [Pseudomonadota bacterium]